MLAEAWGEREGLTPRILRCRGDGHLAPAVTLIEHDDALHYAITMPDRTTVTRLFPADAVERAFTSLLESCEQHGDSRSL